MQHGFIFWIIIGTVAGSLASVLMRGRGLGLLMDIVLGIAGAFVGGWTAEVLGIHMDSHWTGSLITATSGAVLILWISRLIRRA